MERLEAGAGAQTVVISHVLNELNHEGLERLLAVVNQAETVLWVEPGTHAASRKLAAVRAKLLPAFRPVAPCPHANACGMLTPENERHWCHFFASPPANLYADSGWVKFGQRAGIDLRSLPYCFLALDRRPAERPPGLSRIIGEPRLYKGYAKIFNCDDRGVSELMLQKRDEPELFKRFNREGAGSELHAWTHENGRIVPAPKPYP